VGRRNPGWRKVISYAIIINPKYDKMRSLLTFALVFTCLFSYAQDKKEKKTRYSLFQENDDVPLCPGIKKRYLELERVVTYSSTNQGVTPSIIRRIDSVAHTDESYMLIGVLMNYPNYDAKGIIFKLSNGEVIKMPDIKINVSYLGSMSDYVYMATVPLDKELIEKLSKYTIVIHSISQKEIKMHPSYAEKFRDDVICVSKL
jgi:hypothetical protein